MRFLTQKNRAEKNTCQRHSVFSAKFLTQKNQKGFTVMEVLIYVSIFIMMTTIIVRVMSGTFGIFAKSRSIKNLLSVGSSVTERISYNVRNATSFSVTGNSFGTDPGTLSLVVTENGTPRTYYYEKDSTSGILTETIDGGSPQNMHGTEISVDSFQVDQIIAGTYVGAVINLTISDTRINPPESATFKNSVLMRGTY